VNDSIKHLEEKIAYLERHVTEQDKAMLEFAEELAAIRRELKTLRDRFASGSAASEPAEDAYPDERPPHY
jgi:SlyX protein